MNRYASHVASFVILAATLVGCADEETGSSGSGGGGFDSVSAGGGGSSAADAQAADGSSSDAAVSDALVADARDATPDAADATPVPACDMCGSQQMTACAAEIQACDRDQGCVDIRSCVFGEKNAATSCPLRVEGATCVAACVDAHCKTTQSAVLYRALDRCLYCTTCASMCSPYCTAPTDASAPVCGDGG